MQSTPITTLLAAGACLLLVFAVVAFCKIHYLNRHHYRISGDEVRSTNQEKDSIL